MYLCFGTYVPLSQPQTIHFFPFITFVFGGVSQNSLEAAAFFGQSPNQAFSGGDITGLGFKNFILESLCCGDDLPAFFPKEGDQIVQKQSCRQIVVQQDGVRDVAVGEPKLRNNWPGRKDVRDKTFETLLRLSMQK